MGGRKTKLTENFINKMVELINKGVTRNMCCNSLGVSEVSFYSWINDAELIQADIERGNELAKTMNIETSSSIVTINNCILKYKFYNALNEAESKYLQEHIENIARAGTKGNWQASAWILERRRPKEFAKKNVVNIANDEGKPFKTESKNDKTLLQQIAEMSAILEEQDRKLKDEAV